MIKLSLLVAVAAAALATTPSRASLLPGGDNVNFVDCSNLEAQTCPNSSPPPVVTFPSSGGTVTGSSKGCCKTNYLQCQNQVGNALCKTLAEYTITATQGNSETVCPTVPTPCTCQQALAQDKSLTLRFCPTPPVCCPVCECHGDPHCTAFDSSGGSAVWAICDDRDSTCTHKKTSCAKTTYAGKTCEWDSSLGVSGECTRASGTPIPVMTMYSKQYKSYFDPSNDRVYDFSIELTLGSYGVISQVKIRDAGKSHTFTISSAGKCVGTSTYPLNSDGHVYIKNLPSGVWIQLQCMNNAPRTPQRWDVNFVKDPWYVPAQIANTNGGLTSFQGYCTNNLIPENTGGNPGGCRIMDRQLSSYYKCSPTTPITTCKNQFCDKYASKFTFPGATGSKKSQCQAFVKSTSSRSNYLQAACALNQLSPGTEGSTLINPALCLKDYNCKLCVDSINDFPDQIAAAMDTVGQVATRAPTIACPRDLVSIGVNRKSLSKFQSGMQVEVSVGGSDNWQGVFALLDEELTACGGCKKALVVNGSIAENQALLNPGTYRIRQCFGVDTDPSQALCTGPPAYNASLTYYNPLAETAVSRTFGQLFDDGGLVCSADKFKKCPLKYQCCIWDREKQPVAWGLCMDNHHGGAAGYPKCAL